MSDFQIPDSPATRRGTVVNERCQDCGSRNSQPVADLQKCLDCGATWVTGSGQPVYDGPSADEQLYTAWAIISNVNEGDWSKQHPMWVAAAMGWRDRWHEYIGQPWDHNVTIVGSELLAPEDGIDHV